MEKLETTFPDGTLVQFSRPDLRAVERYLEKYRRDEKSVADSELCATTVVKSDDEKDGAHYARIRTLMDKYPGSPRSIANAILSWSSGNPDVADALSTMSALVSIGDSEVLFRSPKFDEYVEFQGALENPKLRLMECYVGLLRSCLSFDDGTFDFLLSHHPAFVPTVAITLQNMAGLGSEVTIEHDLAE